MTKKLRLISVLVLSLFVFSILGGCSEDTQTSEDETYPVEITVFSVGKADAVLVRCDDSYMLIDSGEADDEAMLLSELQKRGIDHLDYFQVTHFDKDHVGSAAAIVSSIDIGSIMYPDYEGTRDEYFAFMEAIADHNNASPVTENTQLSLGGAELTVYPASDPNEFISDDSEYDNELSLVTSMKYGQRVFLFCGDAEKTRLKQMLTEDVDWSCDWMKQPHHGKYCKSLVKFMKAAAPSYTVMTVSEEEPADSDTLELLESLGIESYDTLSGSVVTLSDGQDIVIKPE